jgi:hypothetical protein
VHGIKSHFSSQSLRVVVAACILERFKIAELFFITTSFFGHPAIEVFVDFAVRGC